MPCWRDRSPGIRLSCDGIESMPENPFNASRRTGKPGKRQAHKAPHGAGELRFGARLPGIVFLTGIFFFNFLARFIWSPLLVSIEQDLSIRHTQAGSLFLMVTIGYFGGLVLSGHLSARFNHQKTVVISSLACALAMIGAALSPSLPWLWLALIGIGFATGIYLPTGIASLTYRLRTSDFGKAFALHEMAPSLGFIAGPLLAEALLGRSSWRGVLLPIALGLLISGLWYRVKPWTGDMRGEPLSLRNMRFVASRPALWFMSLPFMLGVGANVGVFSMLPLYLQTERGMDQTVTHLILSASRFAALFSVLVTGWAVARFNARTVAAVTLLLTGAATAALGFFPNDWMWLPLFLQSLLASAFFPPAFSILTSIVPVSYRNLIVAVIMPLSMLLGGGGIPTLIGAFGDAGMFYAGFILTGILAAASAGLIGLAWSVDNGDERPAGPER